MNPIYKPKGAAAEYGDYALNIYTGCPHRCYYCFAPGVRHIKREVFHSYVEPRKDIVRDVRRQLERDETLRGKLIHLCFTCDPYPVGYDTSVTREVIKALKECGNHVQILTKGDGSRDFDLLDGKDWFGVTYTGATCGEEPGALGSTAGKYLIAHAKSRGIKTWVSFEPVINADAVLSTIAAHSCLFDKVKIGKLNYHKSNINWAEFGREVKALCKELGLDYYIKDSLQAEMEKLHDNT